MELILNLAWAILAMAGLYAWVRLCPTSGNSRRAQFVALVMLLLILFPVVSVTDDIWAAHNPAEADVCLRRHELTAHSHTIVPDIPALPVAILMALPPAYVGYAPVDQPLVPNLKATPSSSTFKRPPPAA